MSPNRAENEMLRALDAAIARGIAAAEAGRVKPLAEVFDRLEAKYEALAKTKSQ
jgi:antitoxin ParD1/3/4